MKMKMKVILVTCLVILSHQKTSANYLRPDNFGKSSLSTEYQARFQQRHCDGVNVSEGNIEGNHRFEKATNEEPWESFASKCASIIHGLVAALTSAVAPAPGDATNLELDIKNHIFHHDDRQYNACKPAGALPDCGNVPSTALAPPGVPGGGSDLTYPQDGGYLPPVNDYLSTGAVTLNPGIVYDDDVVQLPQSQSFDGSMGYLPVDVSPTPEPTMNTPATHEASCETTTPNFSSVNDFQNPVYAVPDNNGLPDYDVQNKLIDGSPSYPADVLPLDNWKPCANRQTDLISGNALTDDCCSTSPHLTPGFVTPSSPPPRTLCSNNLAWEKFYNEHPELLSSNSPPKSRSCSPSNNPPWSSGFEWEAPTGEGGYQPPPRFGPDSYSPLPSDGLVTPVPPVTDCSPSGIDQDGYQPYLTPVDDNNSFPEPLPGNNFGAPNASGNDCLPEDTYPNQQPGFVPPFDGMNDMTNAMPGDNIGLPLGSGNDFPLDGAFPNDQPGYFLPIEDAGGASTMPGDFPAPGTDCPPEAEYPNQQDYLQPGNAYNDGALPGQYLGNPAGTQAGAPLDNTFPQQPELLPPLPPPSYNSASPGIIPSDSLVANPVPVPDYSLDNCSQDQPGLPPPLPFDGNLPNSLPSQNNDAPLNDFFPGQQPGQLPPQPFNDEPSNPNPGLPPPLPFDGGLPNSLPGQNDNVPLTDNIRPYPIQQPGQLPPQSFGDEPSNAVPGGPMESGIPAGNSWDPNPQPGQFPPQPFDDGFSNNLPGQGTVEPGQSGLPANHNWDLYPNQQLGQLPAQPFNDGLPNNLPSQDPADCEQQAPVGTDNLGPYPNQQLGQFPPQPCNDEPTNDIPEQNLGGPMGSGPLGTDNWSQYPNQLPGGLQQPGNGGSPYPVPGQNLDGPLGSDPLANNNWGSNQQMGQLPPFNGDSSNALPEQDFGGPMESGPLGNNNWDPYQNQQPVSSGSPYPVPGQNPDGPLESGPLGNNNWNPNQNQQPGGPQQPVSGGSPYPVPGQSLDGPLGSDPLANNNWGPNQQMGQFPPFNGDSSNALPEQDFSGPMEFSPAGNGNWDPYQNQQPGGLQQPVNGGSPYPVPGQNPDGPFESGPLGNNNWNPNQQPGQLPPQPFNDGISNNFPGQGPAEPVQSGPLANNNNSGPFPNQQLGQLPPFNDDYSNTLPGQNPGGPMESGPLGTGSWDPYPNQQPGSLPSQPFDGDSSNPIPEQNLGGPIASGPTAGDNWDQYPNQLPGGLPQPVNGGSPYPVPGQNLDGPLESGPLAGNNWGPNQQLGQLPPRPFNGDSSNALPGQGLGGPMESGPAGSDNWDPYANQQLGSSPYSPVNGGPAIHVPGNDFPGLPSEPDNSLDNNNWGGSPQNQSHGPYGINSPTNFIPNSNPVSPGTPEPGMGSGYGPQPPVGNSEGSNDPPCDSTPSDQTFPNNVITTEPTSNGPDTPEYSDNGYGPAGSNSGYHPFWNQEPSGGNYPAGNANVDDQQPIMPPSGSFQPPALESANQVSEPCPDQPEQAGGSGFQDPEEYPEGGRYIPESTAPVPDYITPAYDDVMPGYNPEMDYHGPEDYGMNAAPNGALPKPIQVPPRYQNGFQPGKPNYYGVPNQGWSPNGLYNPRPQYEQSPGGGDPSAIYIPVDPQQGVMLEDPSQDQDSDEFCSCDDCYYDDIVDHKAFRKTACRDLEEARDELKAIFDKIKKKLKCTQKSKCFVGN